MRGFDASFSPYSVLECKVQGVIGFYLGDTRVKQAKR